MPKIPPLTWHQTGFFQCPELLLRVCGCELKIHDLDDLHEKVHTRMLHGCSSANGFMEPSVPGSVFAHPDGHSESRSASPSPFHEILSPLARLAAHMCMCSRYSAVHLAASFLIACGQHSRTHDIAFDSHSKASYYHQHLHKRLFDQASLLRLRHTSLSCRAQW